MDLSREISAAVARFVARVTELAGDLAHAQLTSALDGPLAGSGGARRRAAAPVARGRVPIGGRRTAAELEQLRQRLLAHITAHPGQRIEQIKVALGASTSELGGPLQKLLYADRIRSEGERRATRYFPAATEEAAAPRRKKAAAARPKAGKVTRGRKAAAAAPEAAAPEAADAREAAAIEEAREAEAADASAADDAA